MSREDLVMKLVATFHLNGEERHRLGGYASVPPGAPPPQGNALTLTVDAQTYRVTDFGITLNVPDLTPISSDVVNLAQ